MSNSFSSLIHQAIGEINVDLGLTTQSEAVVDLKTRLENLQSHLQVLPTLVSVDELNLLVRPSMVKRLSETESGWDILNWIRENQERPTS